MNGAIEAAGDVAAGAALARAVEPVAGEAVAVAGHTACLNCGTALVGRYCHECGQSSRVHRTLMSIVHDLAHGVFHFEGKIWRTVPMLVLHPGQLTRRYIDGERAKFVSPLALFLFTVFLLFASFSAVQTSDLGEGFANGLENSTAQIDRTRADLARQLDAATRERAALAAAGQPTAAADRRLGELRNDAAALATVKYRMVGANGRDRLTVRGAPGWIDNALKKTRENPGLVIYKVQSATYKFSWVLIFLSTPLVALLFLWRRRFGLYDHATFVTYSISFMSMLFIVLQLGGAIGLPAELLLPLAALAPPAHMFVQLRGTYGLRKRSALWRTVVLMALAAVSLIVFVLGVIAFEVSG